MNKFWKGFDLFEELIMVIGFIIMVFFNFLDVVCRYLLPQTPFSYTEELVVIVFVWVSMVGLSYGYRRGSHTVLTIVSDILPRKLQPPLVIFAALASMLLMALMVYTGYGMVINQIEHQQILPGMRIPMWIVGWSTPVGCSLAFISIMRSCWLELVSLKNPEGGKTA